MLQRIRKLFGEPKRPVSTPDPTPVELPLGYRKPETIQEAMIRLIRSETMAQYAAQKGKESFEDFEDFDMDEEGFDAKPTEFEEVYDEELGKYVLPAEKNLIDQARADFDKKRKAYQRAARKKKAQTKEMEPLEPKLPKDGTPSAGEKN